MAEPRRFNFRGIILLVLALVLLLTLAGNMHRSNGITYGEMRELFVQEKVESFSIVEHTLTATLKDESTAVCYL